MTNEERYAAYNAFVSEMLEDGVHHTIPHCDSRILHRAQECSYCAEATDLQVKRFELGIAHTGYIGELGVQIPCEADLLRPPDSEGDHRRWGGNKPTSAKGNEWPEETFASQVMYGPPGERRWEKKDDTSRSD